MNSDNVVEWLDPFRWFVLGWLVAEDGGVNARIVSDPKFKDSEASQEAINALISRSNEIGSDTIKNLRIQFDAARKHPKEKR